MKFDDILTTIGEFGPYQKRIFYLMCLPTMLCGAQVFSSIFIYNIPSYRCRLPGYPRDTYTVQNEAHGQAVNRSIPPAQGGDTGPYSNCQLYQVLNNVSFTTSVEDLASSVGPTRAYPEGRSERCHEWVYDKSEVEESVITEFNLVCDLTILRSHSFMVLFAGALVGSLVMGVIADVLGRKVSILLSLVTQFATTLGFYFATSFEFIIGVRALNGIAVHALFSSSATTGIELVGPNERAYTGVMVEFFWSIGVLGLTPIAYFVRDWRNLQLILCLVSLPLFLTTVWYIPESPRWQLDKRRFQQAEKTLRRICHANGTVLPPGALTDDIADEGPQLQIWHICGHRVLVTRYLIVFFGWLATNIVYYGLTMNTGNLAGSLYVNYLISGLVEGLAYVACLPLLRHFGRRTLFSGGLFLASVTCLGTALSIGLGGPNWLNVSLNMAGKFGVSACYAVLYILTSELFPTVLRYSGIGVCSIFENVGGMASSYVTDLGLLVGGQVGPILSSVVFGGISLLAGFLCLLLPETRGRNIPETIQDVIDFTKCAKNGHYTRPSQQELQEMAAPDAVRHSVPNEPEV